MIFVDVNLIGIRVDLEIMGIENERMKWNTPEKIQNFVTSFPYNPDDYCRSVDRVLQDKKAHCLEGALLAAVLLEKLGHEPRLLHLRAHQDDDHVVALFQKGKYWGAVGKSNTTLLTFRPAIYSDLNSLVLSYFPFYFNVKGRLSLYEWAGPVRLKKYEHWNWRSSDKDISDMGASFYDEKAHLILSKRELVRLPAVEEKTRRACFLGANASGLYKG